MTFPRVQVKGSRHSETVELQMFYLYRITRLQLEHGTLAELEAVFRGSAGYRP